MAHNLRPRKVIHYHGMDSPDSKDDDDFDLWQFYSSPTELDIDHVYRAVLMSLNGIVVPVNNVYNNVIHLNEVFLSTVPTTLTTPKKIYRTNLTTVLLLLSKVEQEMKLVNPNYQSKLKKMSGKYLLMFHIN